MVLAILSAPLFFSDTEPVYLSLNSQTGVYGKGHKVEAHDG